MSTDTECYEKITLFFRAYELPKTGTLVAKTTSFFVLYMVETEKNNALKPLMHSEVIRDNQDPDWTAHFIMNYHFEAVQKLLVRVYHYDGSSPVAEVASGKHTLIGESVFLLSNVMCATASSLTLPLKPSAALKPASSEGSKGNGDGDGDVDFGLGEFEMRGEAVHTTRNNFVVTFSANRLSNKEGFFSTSDPFLKISRCNEDGAFTLVWQNRHISNTLNPKWAEARIPLTLICNGDIDRPLRVEIFDYEKSGRHVFMGQVETSVREMVTLNGKAMSVIEPEVQKKKGSRYINSGTLHSRCCYIEENPTFTDFIAGGLEISLVVAIDFTGSNGDPSMPESLHYVDPVPRSSGGRGYNSYEQAIVSVGQVLAPYDSDQMYPVYGFGAKLRGPDGKNGPVSHCFPVYGGGLEVHGVEGILKAYHDCLQHVTLSGPTLFGPLVRAASQVAAAAGCSAERQQYTVLLVLTDGVINDMDSTKAALIEASVEPLSVVVVGVGEADFTDMHELDSDEQLLQHAGKIAARDIVQFVSYKEVAANGTAALAESVLAEIPDQVLKYMKQHDIKPLPPKPKARAPTGTAGAAPAEKAAPN